MLHQALNQLQNLQPANHDFLRLNAIRAAALGCQIPLQAFLNKISKFDNTLGVVNASNLRFRGFSETHAMEISIQRGCQRVEGEAWEFCCDDKSSSYDSDRGLCYYSRTRTGGGYMWVASKNPTKLKKIGAN